MAKNNETTTKFNVDISELTDAMQKAKRQIQVANSEFKSIASSMDDWSKSSDGLSAKTKQLEKNLTSQKKILRSLEDQYVIVAAEQGENSKAADNLKIKMNNQQAAINKTEKELENYTEELDRVARAEIEAVRSGRSVEEVLNDVGDEAKDAGEGFTVLKGAIADLAADAIRNVLSAVKDLAKAVVEVGSGFSSSMSEVQAISGASAEDLEKLEATAREYGATTTFSASEAADALKYMALAGWDANQSTDALGGILNLAAASGMELASASDMVTDYLSAFGMEAKDSAYFADLLAYAQGNSNTSAQQLGEAYKNCAANLNAAGQDVETTTSLLAAMANQGLKGSEGGTALAAMMRDLTAKMDEGKIAIGETNVEVMDANGNYRDLTDILKDVEAATNGMGDAEKATALSSTFTSDSIKGLNLILNDGVDKAANFEEALRNSSGTAETMAGIMNDNLAGDVKAFQSALEELALKVYDALEPALRDIIAFVQELANQFNEWLADPANKQAIDDLGAKLTEFVQGALQNIMDAIKWFIENKDGIIAGLTGIAAGFAAFKVVGIVTSAISKVKELGTAITVLKAIIAALGGPVTIIITIIAALVAGFITLWNTSDEFRNFWINLWETVKNACITGWEAVKNFFTVTIPNTFNTVVTAVGAFITNIGTSIKEFFTVKIPEFLQAAVDWFNDLPYKIGYALGYVIARIIQFGIDMWNFVTTKIPEIIENIVTFFSELPSKLWTWLVATITKIGEWMVNMKIKAAEAGVNFVNNLINFIKTLPERFWTWLTNVITKVTTWATDLSKKGKEAGQQLLDSIINKVKEIPDKMKSVGSDIVRGLWNGINDMSSWIGEKIKGFGDGVLQGIKDFFQIGSPSRLMAKEVGKWLPAGIAVGVEDNAKSVLDSMKELTAQTVSATAQGLQSTTAATGGAMGGVVNNFTQINNSPKALSRLELYRQSKNLLGYAGGGL